MYRLARIGHRFVSLSARSGEREGTRRKSDGEGEVFAVGTIVSAIDTHLTRSLRSRPLPPAGGEGSCRLCPAKRNPFKALLRNQEGATMVEYSIVFLLLMTLSFGIVEFGYFFWQWNSAEKATQMGVHKAVLTNPINSALATTTAANCDDSSWDGATPPPGTQCPSGTKDAITCTGVTANSANCTGGWDGLSSCNGCDGTAFNWILTQMQAIFPNIKPTNVKVVYNYIGLGFYGRGSAVPAVTVELTGMTFNFVALNSLVGLGPITMPDFRATLTAEDLNSAG